DVVVGQLEQRETRVLRPLPDDRDPVSVLAPESNLLELGDDAVEARLRSRRQGNSTEDRHEECRQPDSGPAPISCAPADTRAHCQCAQTFHGLRMTPSTLTRP